MPPQRPKTPRDDSGALETTASPAAQPTHRPKPRFAGRKKTSEAPLLERAQGGSESSTMVHSISAPGGTNDPHY